MDPDPYKNVTDTANTGLGFGGSGLGVQHYIGYVGLVWIWIGIEIIFKFMVIKNQAQDLRLDFSKNYHNLHAILYVQCIRFGIYKFSGGHR